MTSFADDNDNDEIQYPSGFGLNDVVAWGTTGLVVLEESSRTVIKTRFDPQNEDCVRRLTRGLQIYERLAERGGHKEILHYHGTFEGGIRLEYTPHHDLRSYDKRSSTSHRQKQRWAVQIADALGFLHGAGVVHGDLTCSNPYLDEKPDAKVADFAGSSMDGSPLLMLTNHGYPGDLLSVKADLFALGCVLYEIATGRGPYEELSEKEARDRYRRGEFPDTKSLRAIGPVISKCWQGGYDDCDAVVCDLKGMITTFNPSIPAKISNPPLTRSA